MSFCMYDGPFPRSAILLRQRLLHIVGRQDLVHRLLHIQPAGIVAGIALIRLGVHLTVDEEFVVIEIPPVSRYPEIVAHILAAQPLFPGHQGLEQLLAVAGADDLGTGVSEQLLHRLRQHPDGGGVALLNEQIARLGMLKSKHDQIHSLVQIHKKTGHIRIGDGDGLACTDLINEQRDHAAPAAHHIAVAGAADGGILRLDRTGLGADDLFHHGLGDAHGVDGISGLVGGQAYHLLDARVDRGGKNIVGADHIGAHRLHGEELAGRHLLECRRVENIVYAANHTAHAADLPHIADVKADLAREFRKFLLIQVTHVILLFFVPAEDADLRDVGAEKMFEHRVAKTAGSSCDQKCLAAKNILCHKTGLRSQYFSYSISGALPGQQACIRFILPYIPANSKSRRHFTVNFHGDFFLFLRRRITSPVCPDLILPMVCRILKLFRRRGPPHLSARPSPVCACSCVLLGRTLGGIRPPCPRMHA